MHIVTNDELVNILDDKDIGGKARGLLMLAKYGYTIPPTHILTINGYDEFLGSKGSYDNSELDKLVDTMYNDLMRLKYSIVILRSSAENEDGVTASFSGMLKSTIVKSEKAHSRDFLKHIVQRMLEVPLDNHWQEYNQAKGMTSYPKHFTFVIQPYLKGEMSGVLFTMDPVSGNDKVTVIELVSGGNEALTSGTTVPALICIDMDSMSIIRFESGDDEFKPDDSLLALMTQLSICGKSIEAFMDCPQDIEWLYKDGEFVFLQTRPITTIKYNA